MALTCSNLGVPLQGPHSDKKNAQLSNQAQAPPGVATNRAQAYVHAHYS